MPDIPTTSQPIMGLRFSTSILCAALLAGAAHAATEDEQSKACKSDALHFCAADIPDKPKITACMKQHYSELSPDCKKMFHQPSKDSSTGNS